MLQNQTDALKALEQLRHDTNVNPSIEVPSDIALAKAELWIKKEYQENKNNAVIYFVRDGSSGICVEWRTGKNYVSIWFDAKDEDMDIVSYSFNGNRKSSDLSIEACEMFLKEFFDNLQLQQKSTK